MNKLSKSEFNLLYTTKIKPRLNLLEQERKRLITNGFATLVFLAIAALTIIKYVEIPPQIPLVLALIIFGLSIYSPLKKFTAKYKSHIVEFAITQTFPECHYTPTSTFTLAQFNQLKIASSANRIKSEDEINGKFNNNQFSMREVVAKHESGSGKNRKVIILFRGLIYTLNFNKKFQHQTVIVPDQTEGLLGKLIAQKLQSIRFDGLELVKLEDINFEKRFAVFSTDQIEARYLLTPAFMEKLLLLINKHRLKVSISFLDNQMNIAVHLAENLFEPYIFGSLVTFKELQKIYDIISLADAIYNDLNLNINIWKL